MEQGSMQQSLSERLKRIKELEEFRQRQKQYQQQKRNSYYNSAMAGRNMIGSTGKLMSMSNNPKVANLGNKMYTYSGQGIYDKMKNYGWDSLGKGIGQAGSKIGAGASNSAATGTAIAEGGKAMSSAASNATSAGGPWMGAIGGGLSAVNNAAQKNYVDAGIDALSAAASFIPVYGWAVSGALQAGKAVKNAIKGEKDKQAKQITAQANAANNNAMEKKQEVMNNISQNNGAVQGDEDIKQRLFGQVQAPNFSTQFKTDLQNNLPSEYSPAQEQPQTVNLQDLDDESLYRLRDDLTWRYA